MKRDEIYGSLAGNDDCRRAMKAGKVRARVKLPPLLSLPFQGKPEKVFARQVAVLSERLRLISCRHIVLGLSGGLDSSLALLVAVAAFRQLKLPLCGIHLFTMPGFGTTRRTKGNAEILAEGLGLSCETIDITAACRRHFRDIGHDGKTPDATFENTQARMRTMILMDKANMLGAIVLGTGDMSEIALGWSTYNGDHMSMFGVNAGVPKTVVREVCLWWAKKHGGAAGKALEDIVATPISPELIPGQVTESKLGPYELHDFFLAELVGRNHSRAEIFEHAFQTFGRQYDATTIAHWLDVFLRRIVSQAFKRNCAPDGIQVWREVYFAPNAWRTPSDLSPAECGW